MKRKMILFGLALVVLTGAILFGSLVYMTNLVLPKGSVEEFAALHGPADSELYRAEEKLHGGGGQYVISNYLKELPADSELRQQLGGAQWVEQPLDNYALFYVTQPSHELREQIQEEPEFQYMEVALAKCDFSLVELDEALDALDVYLASAPISVRNSVQTSLISPRGNRVAIYVKNWSAFDQLSLAKAMGTMCPRLFIVEEDLDKAMPQMEFIHYDRWMYEEEFRNWALPEYGGTGKEIPKEIAVKAGKKMEQILDEYMLCLALTDGTKNWRSAGLVDGAGNNQFYGCLQTWSWKQMPVYYDPYSRPAQADFDHVSYVYYDEWGKAQEYLTKAVFREMADFAYPIVVLHSY